MATADQYAEWIVANQSKKGTPEFETVAAAYKEAKATPVQEDKGALEQFGEYAIGNTLGAVRGAADIGNTLINASSYLPRKIAQAGADAMGVENPLEKLNQNREQGLNDWTAENQERPGFNVGRIGANVAGTAGTGNVLGGAVQGISQAPRALQFAEALRTGGMSAQGAGMPLRMAAGAATGGAATGLVSPEDADTGALIGGLMPPAVKGAYALGKGSVGGAKSLVEPFYQGGRERIIGRAINQAAGNQADDALLNLQNAQPLVPGSQPTAGMVAQNPGIAALERASVANNPIATNELALRQAANSDARTAALQNIIPDRQAAQTARETATEALYGNAARSEVQITPGLKKLFERPSLRSAIGRAQELAKERGESLIVGKDIPASVVDSPILDDAGAPFTKEVEAQVSKMSGKAAQYIKMALDDLTNAAPAQGISGNELGAIRGTKSAYLGELEQQIPDYLKANRLYADMSKPLNQADVLEEIMNKSQNFRGDLTPAKLAANLSDRTAQRVTGRPNAKLADVLDPKQLDTLNNVKADLLNQDFAQTAGRGAGSNTVQNLAYTNMLDQIGIPTGLRSFGPVGAVGNVVGQVGNLGYKKANEQLAAELAEALLDPQKAAEVMQKAKVSPYNAQLAEALKLSMSRAVPAIASPQYSQ